MLTIGRGEVVTVRVPTHEDGAYLFWEFATDSYDLGFGVYFEWSDVKTNQVLLLLRIVEHVLTCLKKGLSGGERVV